MKLAQKYDIKVAATLFPFTNYSDISGWKFPRTQRQLDNFGSYIEKVVSHFRQYDCIFTWVLMNEPGGGFNDGDFLKQKRIEWYKEHPFKKNLENGYANQGDLREWQFQNEMTTSMLEWVAKEIRKYDTTKGLHVNGHSLFNMAQTYDFPKWRGFLTTLGGSAHPSWHFNDFDINEFDVAMLAYSEIINSGAGNLPWFMTELQGGNNTFSGERKICPTKEEIAQWLWSIVATNGRGAIFWSLNAKASGLESGEWALIDFQGNASDRMIAASEVAKCIFENKKIFSTAKKFDSGVNILYVKESLQVEREMMGYGLAKKSVIWPEIFGFFKAYARLGIGANLSSFDEFDFSRADYSGHTVILANQIALPKGASKMLENFVSKGGTLIVEGQTFFYDDNIHCIMMTDFEYEKLLGGRIKEFKRLRDSQKIALSGKSLVACPYKGIIARADGAEILYESGGEVLAIKNKFGSGNVIWIPSTVATVELQGLAEWLKIASKYRQPATFKKYENMRQMKMMEFDNGYLGVITDNSSNQGESSGVRAKDGSANRIIIETELKDGRIIFANKTAMLVGNSLKISSGETVVIEWKKQK